MPHCIIEVTKNMIDRSDNRVLMENVARAIYSLDCFRADDIKVRCYTVEKSFLGIVPQDHAFATATVQVLDNKSKKQLEQLAKNVQNVLMDHFSFEKGKLSITTQIAPLDPQIYQRYKNFNHGK